MSSHESNKFLKTNGILFKLYYVKILCFLHNVNCDFFLKIIYDVIKIILSVVRMHIKFPNFTKNAFKID